MKVKTFIKSHYPALSLVTISVVFMVVVIIVLYFKFKNMKTAIVPLKGRITSKFGQRIVPVAGASSNHNGVDIAAPSGTAIIAPLNGTVSKMYFDAKGGNQLVIKHGNGYKTGYAHLSKYAVKDVGETVKQGQVIAYVGNTGFSTGAHLHFTVTNPLGIKVNPEDYFNFL